MEGTYRNAPDFQELPLGVDNLYNKTFGNWKVLYYIGLNSWKCVNTLGKTECLYDKLLESESYRGTNIKSESGNTYGKLKVISYYGNKKWLCECSCGNVAIIDGKHLRNGDKTSCGKCIYRGADLTGKHFGEWIAQYYAGNLRWHCKCSCGAEADILTQSLISGRSQSCGCMAKDKREISWRNTMIHKYRDVSHTRFQKPRENWQICTVLDRDKLSAFLDNLKVELDRKPYMEDAASKLDITISALDKHIKYYGLQDRIAPALTSSHKENELLKLIGGIYKGKIEHNNRDIISGLELDIYIADKNIAFEFNGTYWHSSYQKDKLYHQRKSLRCRDSNIQLVHIYEYEWDTNKDLIKSYIKDLLTQKKVIYARDCIVITLSNSSSSEFLNSNHLQGAINSTICYGLVHNNKLVSIMTFGTPRFRKDYEWELLRYSTLSGYTVVGGAEKIFKHFISRNRPYNIVSYCSIDKFTGSIYERLGFKLSHISEPNYFWVNKEGNVLSRYKTTKQRLIKSGLGTSEDSEASIMEREGYYKIYDSGNYVYTLDNIGGH